MRIVTEVFGRDSKVRRRLLPTKLYYILLRFCQMLGNHLSPIVKVLHLLLIAVEITVALLNPFDGLQSQRVLWWFLPTDS